MKIIYSYIALSIPVKYEYFLNKSIWSIDGTLGQKRTRDKSNEEYSTLAKSSEINPHLQIQFSIIPKIPL